MFKAKALMVAEDIWESKNSQEGTELNEPASALSAELKSATQAAPVQTVPLETESVQVALAKTGQTPGILGLLNKGQQNLTIESYAEEGAYRDCLVRLAVLLVKEDALLKGYIQTLRQQHCTKAKSFSLSIAGRPEEEKTKLRHIFAKEMAGVVDSVDIKSNWDMISGNLVFAPAAYKFITGQYMEMGVFEIVRQVMEEIVARHNIQYKLYRNVVVTTRTGIIRNEFDVVIECEGRYYVIEVKSGEHFNAWGCLVDIGREYGIVPDRLLLVDSWIDDETMGRVEAFCGYYVSNLSKDSLRKKVLAMIINDL